MATVSYLNENYECSVALKGADYIHLLDEGGYLIAAFDGITSFSGFTISGGSWTVPAPDNDCYLAVVRDDGTITKGGHKCCNVLTNTDTIPVSRGGTGATTVAAARNALGLGNTSGAVPIANGGTGKTTAADARTALGITPANIGAAPTSHDHGAATTSAAGFMSASDKSNLNTVVGRVNQSLTTTSSPTFASVTATGTITANKVVGAVYA